MSPTTAFDDILHGSGDGSTNAAYHGPTVRSQAHPKAEPHREAWIDDATEPADPPRVDHESRRETRIVDCHRDPETLPKPLVECGCGDCPDAVDPLAEEDGPFDDVLNRGRWAAEECDSPLPVTVEKAAEIYFAYQMARYQRNQGCRLYDVAETHRAYCEAERELLRDWGDTVTTALLSLRVRPVEDELPDSVDGDGREESNAAYHGPTVRDTDQIVSKTKITRYWVPPVKTDTRLRNSWRNVTGRLRAHLNDFEWEYAWIVSPTQTAATPHLHVYLWVDDPGDELTVEHCRPAVEAFCRNTPNAYLKDHPIERGASDAVVISHDPTGYDAVEDDTVLKLYHDIGDDAFQMNTAGFAYMLNQRPEWAIKRIAKGTATIDEERTMLEGAATAWASPKRWVGGSVK